MSVIRMKAWLARILWFLAGALSVVLLGVGYYVTSLRARLPLEPWHLAHLDAEFSTRDLKDVRNLNDYLRREEQVFEQLDREVYARVPPAGERTINRYAAGSIADPRARRPDWNRTMELRSPRPVAAALLLHGASDSPYSMRALAERLHARGFEVLALRLPGHGTAPAGLARVRWEDWAAAAGIGARHLASRLSSGQPLYLIGFSTGGALAVEYALARLQGEDLPAVRGLVLVSPAIGVSPVAAFAVWQARLAMVPGLEQLAWSSNLPEFDPFKYGSFAVNTGDQVYRLTVKLQAELDALAGAQGVSGLPPILAFQSVADATVSTPALLGSFFRRLAPEGHQLVLFDINRFAPASQFLEPAMSRVRSELLDGGSMPFDLTVLSVASADEDAIIEYRRAAGESVVASMPLPLAWPRTTFSLSHVALPFPPDDPVYGAQPPEGKRLPYLGRLAAQGERGVIAVPATAVLRIRHNPFFGYLADRVDAFTGGGDVPR